MRQERGDIVLVAGSTPETSPDYAPPNTPYNDAPSEIAQVFGDANTHVVGPYTDRWGTFVSAYVRVPATAGTAYVLGMDVNADHWFRKVRLNRLAPIVIVILMALLVLVFVVLQQSNIETRDVLQESQRMLTTLMGNLPGMAYRCSNDTRWTMTFVSGGCQALTGYSPAELLNDRRVTYAEIIKADHRQRVWDKVQQAVAKRRAYELTYPIIRSDGSERWVWERGRAVHGADGTILSLEGFITDINERHQAEEALRESEKRFRTLFEQSPDAIFVEDNHGRVLDANPAACRLHGVTREQLLATPVTDLVPPEDRVNFNDQFRNVVDGTWRHFESRSYTVDKRTVPVDVHVSRITYGGAPGLLFHVRDISERVRVEEERRALEAQAQQTQKLESLGVLAGGIAHDFNNLLMAILGNVELALRLVSSTAQERLHLYEIEKTAHRAADLCRQMLAYAGRGRFMLEQLNLNDLIVDMQQIFAVACSKKARLEYQLASEVPAIVGDATQVRQVVMNLVINAAEALGDAAGIITIRTGIHKGTVENDDIYLMPLEAVKDTPCIVVEVSDTGCGMDDETKSKMFDPFFSTKLVGRGLGLAAVQGIMRGHRGAVTVCSEVGVGTRFRLYFPVAQQMVTPTCKTQSPSTWRGAGLVLLVDDEAAIRVAGARMLEVLGFTTVVAANGREAIEVFQRHAEHLRCVVLDLTMPLMDGVETFDELRRIRPAVAIIVASGYGEQDVAPRFAGRCLSGFVQKPYSLETLKTVLRAALEHTTPSSST
jgi:PAS domain S-box-containing protein